MATGSDAESAREFQARLEETPIKPGELCGFLDRLGAEDRLTAVRSIGRSAQRRLYAAVEGVEAVGLRDIVPPGTPALATVRHHGRNTLPAFTHFEKRFCRPPRQDAEHPAELWGFNFQTLSPVTGPGYFIAREDPNRGEVWVDYRDVPPEAPAGWPAVRSNERGPGRFVYGFMVDTLRRVSEHVTIGSASRKGQNLGSWFVLCREA